MYRKQQWEHDLPPSTPGPSAKGDGSETPLRPSPPLQPAAAPAEGRVAAESPVAGAGLSAAGGAPKRTQRLTPRRLALGVVLAVAACGAGWFGYGWWTVGRFTISTDDAYVDAYNTTLAAKVSGYVANVRVTDNSRVHAGDVIATLDDGDYRLAMDSAREKVATQEATIARIGHQIEAQQAAVAQARAQLASTQAAVTRARLEWERQTKLAAQDFASHQTLEQAQMGRDQAIAGAQAAQAALDSAIANVDVLKDQRREATSTLGELKTATAKAQRDLSFTVIRAPIDGVIGNRAVQVGDYVQPGQRLASVVPLDRVYITANFKETQLARLRPGQTVTVAVDALPAHDIEGTIESLSPASGAVFSLLPPDNATGNFTKIVQRLPVRVHVPDAIVRERVLRPGMSVVVSVNTKDIAAAGAATRTAATD